MLQAWILSKLVKFELDSFSQIVGPSHSKAKAKNDRKETGDIHYYREY